jgi:hypothetical protein
MHGAGRLVRTSKECPGQVPIAMGARSDYSPRYFKAI